VGADGCNSLGMGECDFHRSKSTVSELSWAVMDLTLHPSEINLLMFSSARDSFDQSDSG
jgi:hypothetical protein